MIRENLQTLRFTVKRDLSTNVVSNCLFWSVLKCFMASSTQCHMLVPLFYFYKVAMHFWSHKLSKAVDPEFPIETACRNDIMRIIQCATHIGTHTI